MPKLVSYSPVLLISQDARLAMLTDEVRSRLARLNRQPMAVPSSGGSLPKRLETPRQTAGGSTSELPDGEEIQNTGGRHWLLARRLADVWPDATGYLPRAHARLRRSAESDRSLPSELVALADHFPDGAVYLDLETCGFAGSMIFLVGLIRHRRDGLYLVQLLARNYAEERAVLCTLGEMMAGSRLLVTFNGKSFDWPLVRDRRVLHRLNHDRCEGDGREGLVHLDLLHHARRRWKGRLPDCRLQTLERLICGRHRSGDIPGHEIPAAYHHFVHTHDAWQIRSILHHNALDLVTLLELSLRIVA